MTPPPPMVRKPREPKTVQCPTCGRYHWPHPEFGQFCCASCLQTPIRPLIVTPEVKPHAR
jgi:hypothetical protein